MTTVADLINAHACSPACIAAVTTTARCRCVCNGQWHGLLVDAHIDGLIMARRVHMNRMTDAEILAGAA